MADSKALKSKDLLDGKVALVTGASSGIGRATALLFSKEGAAIALVDLDPAHGRTVAATIEKNGGRAVFVAADVSRAGDCQRAVETAILEFGRIDILFNGAGVIRRATVIETSEEDWDRVMAVNVKSVFLLSKYAIPAMVRSGGGVVINISSGWGLVGGKKAAAYCASKGAVIQLTRAMAIDHAAEHIRVNAICPGDTDTQMLRSEAAQLGEPVELFLKEGAERPLGRIGRPEEIAQAALFLATDASSFVTGTYLAVDGGGTAG
jgi:NAD(P)-dependent dehydrogenase (short-subunit alcohol dehydrogenase family)